MEYNYQAGLSQSNNQNPETNNYNNQSNENFFEKYKKWALPVFAVLIAAIVIILNLADRYPKGRISTLNSFASNQKEKNNAAENNCSLSTNLISKALKIDSYDIMGYYVGAVCRYTIQYNASQINLTFAWYENNDLKSEVDANKKLGYNFTDKQFLGTPGAQLVLPNNGGCADIATDPKQGSGIIELWLQPNNGGSSNLCSQTDQIIIMSLGSRD